MKVTDLQIGSIFRFLDGTCIYAKISKDEYIIFNSGIKDSNRKRSLAVKDEVELIGNLAYLGRSIVQQLNKT